MELVPKDRTTRQNQDKSTGDTKPPYLEVLRQPKIDVANRRGTGVESAGLLGLRGRRRAVHPEAEVGNPGAGPRPLPGVSLDADLCCRGEEEKTPHQTHKHRANPLLRGLGTKYFV